MKLLTGKHKGQEATAHQWANDWISYDTKDGGHGIIRPSSVELTKDEADMFRATEGDWERVGSFWREWTLVSAPDDEYWRFKRPRA